MSARSSPRCNGASKGLPRTIKEEMKRVLDELYRAERGQSKDYFYTKIDVPGIMKQVNDANYMFNNMIETVRTWFPPTALPCSDTRLQHGEDCECDQCTFHSDMETVSGYEHVEEIILSGDRIRQGNTMRVWLELTINKGYHMYDAISGLQGWYEGMMLNDNGRYDVYPTDAVIDQHESDDLSSPFETPNRYAVLAGLSD